MPQTLENPFTDPKDKPQKRLFGGGEKKRRLGTKSQERMNKIKEKVKYGNYEIRKNQVGIVYEMEKVIKKLAENEGKELDKKQTIDKVIETIDVDRKGNIVSLVLFGKKLQNLDDLPSISLLTELKEASFGYCGLHYLPNLDNLTKLQYLDCRANKLKKIPDLTKLTKLKEFRGNRNEFSDQEKAKIKKQVPEDCEVKI